MNSDIKENQWNLKTKNQMLQSKTQLFGIEHERLGGNHALKLILNDKDCSCWNFSYVYNILKQKHLYIEKIIFIIINCLVKCYFIVSKWIPVD